MPVPAETNNPAHAEMANDGQTDQFLNIEVASRCKKHTLTAQAVSARMDWASAVAGQDLCSCVQSPCPVASNCASLKLMSALSGSSGDTAAAAAHNSVFEGALRPAKGQGTERLCERHHCGS